MSEIQWQWDDYDDSDVDDNLIVSGSGDQELIRCDPSATSRQLHSLTIQ